MNPKIIPALQAERERNEGLPVAPFMDKNKVTKATAQIGFIQFVLAPLFDSLAKVNILCFSSSI